MTQKMLRITNNATGDVWFALPADGEDIGKSLTNGTFDQLFYVELKGGIRLVHRQVSTEAERLKAKWAAETSESVKVVSSL
jgi:hypothetical protein